MRKSKSLHPCFLPEHYRERLMEYQADIDRSIEGNEARGRSDEQPDPASEEMPERDDGPQ